MRPTFTCTVTGRKLLAEWQLFYATVVAIRKVGRHKMPARGFLASERFSSLILSPVTGHGLTTGPDVDPAWHVCLLKFLNRAAVG